MLAKFLEAKAAIERGDKTAGLAMLAAIIHEDPANEPAWIWMASTIDDPEKKRQCYQHVLALNPNNGAAQRAMALLDKGQTETKKTPLLCRDHQGGGHRMPVLRAGFQNNRSTFTTGRHPLAPACPGSAPPRAVMAPWCGRCVEPLHSWRRADV
jgi:hypothetical protein